MDLGHLRSFLHVAELGSLSRAADRLHISQPALSRQVQLLEAELGAALFERTGRGMRLTDAGALLMRRAEPLLRQFDQLAEDIHGRDEILRGSVSLAVPPSFGARASAELVERFREAHSQVKLRVVVALGGSVREGLLTGQLDLGVMYGPVDRRNLRTEELWTESLVLLSACGKAPATSGALGFAQLRELPLVLPTGDHGLRRVLELHSAAMGHDLQSAVDVDSLQVGLELVRRGVGHTVLPRRAAAEDLERGTLVATAIRRPTPRRTALLVHAQERPPSRAALALAEIVRAVRRG